MIIVGAFVVGTIGGFLGGYLCLWTFIRDLSNEYTKIKKSRKDS